jgi:TonB family protein
MAAAGTKFRFGRKLLRQRALPSPGPKAVRISSVALLIALATAARAQVDTRSGQAPRTNLDLPRDAFDLKPRTEDLHVPPAWRDVERGSAAAFRPAASLVSKRGPAALMTRQLAAAQAAVRAIDEGHGDPAITMSRDHEAELRRRLEEEPAEWVRTEIEVEVAANGDVESIAIVASSGRRELDQEALRAVKRTLAQPHPSAKSAATVRFACDAGVVATPPLIGKAQGDPRNQGIAAGMRIRFDETTGKVDPQLPLVRRVVTRIHIIDFADRK